MAELPIYPNQGEGPGQALERRRLKLGPDWARIVERCFPALRTQVVRETLRLTGVDVSNESVEELAAMPRRDSDRSSLVCGLLDALAAIEGAAAESRTPDVALIREAHRLTTPSEDGSFRSSDIEPQFASPRPSAPQFIEAKLENLLEWLSAESGRSMFPAERMALWLPRFVEIAPFHHGNFRTAHLFLSYFSLASDYPPVTLRVADADAIRADVERALRFDTLPLVTRCSDSLARSLSVCEEVS